MWYCHKEELFNNAEQGFQNRSTLKWVTTFQWRKGNSVEQRFSAIVTRRIGKSYERNELFYFAEYQCTAWNSWNRQKILWPWVSAKLSHIHHQKYDQYENIDRILSKVKNFHSSKAFLRVKIQATGRKYFKFCTWNIYPL